MNVTWMLYPMLIYAVAYIALRAIGARRLRFWRRDSITPASVKEGLDTLPMGLCYYWTGGQVKLINTRMNEICVRLTGTPLADAETFWRLLSDGNTPGTVQGGDLPIVSFSDGTTIGFRRSTLSFEGAPLYELTAADITEEYVKNQELHDKERQASYIKRRLRALSSDIKYMVMDEEVLSAKIHIHDSLGQCLLLTKRWLDGGAVDEDKLVRTWRLNLRLLENREEGLSDRAYLISRRYAEALGIRLEIRGRLPEDAGLRSVIDDAVRVHVTNVMRHARGETAYITVVETADVYRLVFSNDGEPPKSEARETGGLRNLRAKAERMGGSMELRSLPRFALILTLPKEGTELWPARF